MSGPLAEWVTVHYSKSGPLPELDPHARFVLVVLALRAKHDGSDANLTREQISKQTGLSEPAIKRAVHRIADAKAIAQGPHPGRGQPRERSVRIWWCAGDCYTCGLLAGFQPNGKGIAGDPLSTRKGVAGGRKGVAGDPPYGTKKGLTGEQYRAMRWAQQSAPRALAPPGSGGRSRPAPWNPPTGRTAGPSDVSSTSSEQAVAVVCKDDPAEPEQQGQEARKEAEMATLLSFPADRTSRPAAAGGTA